MGINFYAIGGYDEVGRNMCAVEVDDEVVIFDIGLYIPAIIGYEEEQEKFTAEDMQRIKAIPDDTILKDLKDKVKAVVLGHAHLDHIGGLPYLIKNYKNATIVGTPFTINVLEKIAKDKDKKIHNKIKKLRAGNRFNISKNLSIEFFEMTHSIPGCILSVLDTPYGKIAYSLDFKLDNSPILGKKIDYKRLGNLGNVHTLVLDSLYSKDAVKTPSEKVAKELLKEVLLGTDNRGKAIIITTFSSHIARLHSIFEFGKILRRKVVFLGRSLNRYVRAAEEEGIAKFSHQVDIVAYGNSIRNKIKQINKTGSDKYIIVCTGNQAEQGSVLVKIVNGFYPFKFNHEDHVIFACRTIPVEENILARQKLENKLEKIGCRIFKDIHVSGHGGREDDRDLIKLINPKHIIPAHGGKNITKPANDLANELGYETGKGVHILRDGQKLKLI